MRLAVCYCIIALHLVWAGSATGADPYNPKPADGDRILPMPNGVSMVFRPVFIGEGDKPFALKKFPVGEPAGKYPYNNPRRLVGLGGAFRDERQGKRDWLYYLGKYEVMEDQYYALMDPSRVGKPNGQQPISDISWFQAQEFIHKYNTWLFANAKDKLPTNDETVGFVRLPTETEWEFAARGGAEVRPEQFEQRLSYKEVLTGKEALSKYEWFRSVSSSAMPHKAGQLEPNILQLYDMLGNVSEMTASYYQMEYYQGRIGGFVTRGGNYFTAEQDMSSALRDEQPFYNRQDNYAAAHSQTLGMRLALSAPVIAGTKSRQEIAQGWAEYLASPGANVPVGGSTLPSVQVGVELAQAVDIVKSLLNTPTLSQDTLRQLRVLYESFAKIESSRKAAVVDAVSNLFQLATERALVVGFKIRQASIRLGAFETAQKGHPAQDTLRIMHEAIEEDLEEANTWFDNYRFILQKLDEYAQQNKESFEEARKQYRENVVKSKDKGRLEAFEGPVNKHLDEYAKAKKASIDPDFQQWKVDLANIKNL